VQQISHRFVLNAFTHVIMTLKWFTPFSL